jgi:hypothetical protein
MNRFLFCAALATAPLAGAAAQGTIGGQGFGYPAGQMGARSAATGGALSPFDAISPVNPATISEWQRTVLFFHIEPEYRSTDNAGNSASTRLSRFPLAGGATRIRGRGAFALTFSTYLDRTWETTAVTPGVVDGDEVDITTRNASEGAINDVRFALAWPIGTRIQVGGAYHAYTGENRLAIAWDFPDDRPFGDVAQQMRLSYSGRAASAGAVFSIPDVAAASVYGRWGGGLKLRANDTLVSEAEMPDHLGVSLRYSGLRGTTFAAGWERVQWTAMRNLGSTALGVRDGDKVSFGAETRGPTVGRTPVFVRFGGSRRTLPFDALGREVTETLLGIGAGFPVAAGRGNIDFALQRASRSAGGASERGWLFMLGIAISP